VEGLSALVSEIDVLQAYATTVVLGGGGGCGGYVRPKLLPMGSGVINLVVSCRSLVWVQSSR
jgi:hypothetical protein